MVSRISRLFRREGPEIGCEHVRDLSSDFIDDDMDEAERNRVMEHLEKCGLCLAFINTLRATVGLLGSTNTPEPPPTLQDRIRANLPLDENQKQG